MSRSGVFYAVKVHFIFPSTKVKENGAPEEIRTPDPQIRSLMLYPAELRVRCDFRLRRGAVPRGEVGYLAFPFW